MLKNAAALGHVGAKKFLKNFEKTLIEGTKAAIAKNDAHNIAAAGTKYLQGIVVKKDLKKAFKLLTKAAELGNDYAMANLGAMYRNGEGVKKDLNKAFEFFTKAAELGNDYAMAHIGNIYHNGEGVPQDYSKAREWYEKAATSGDAVAMEKLKKLRK